MDKKLGNRGSRAFYFRHKRYQGNVRLNNKDKARMAWGGEGRMDEGTAKYKRYLEGDDEALVEIIRDYKDGLILFLNRYVHNVCVAEELAEDTFVRLFTRRPHFRPGASFKTWLYVIGRNAAISYLRRAKRFSPESLENYPGDSAEEELLEMSYLREERRKRVHNALSKVSQEYGRILFLKFFEELSNEEIARVLGKTKRQVENQLWQAKQAAKKALEKEGFGDEKLF